MSITVKIDKNVPLPEVSYLQPVPLKEMEVGDSFLLKKLTFKMKAALRQRITRFQKAHPKTMFSMRQEERQGDLFSIRVFRMKDVK